MSKRLEASNRMARKILGNRPKPPSHFDPDALDEGTEDDKERTVIARLRANYIGSERE